LKVYFEAPKKIAAWLLKRQLSSNPDDRGTTRKTITLCPVFKYGSKTDVSNYRPIALISNFAKIFEQLLAKIHYSKN
jgi:hypothetical protein